MSVQSVSEVEGRLEVVLDGRAIGWAWDPSRPETAVEVEVVVDGRPVATGTADIERKMLVDAGLGTGNYGFDIVLPEELGNEPQHTIRVTAGPDGADLIPIAVFETIARSPHGPWQQTEFTPEGKGDFPEPFVPAEEPPPDPGEAALVGEDGWLFVADDSNLTAAQLAGAPLLEPAAVEHQAQAAAERRRRLKELRIPYLFAVAPMKERLYGKFLPEGVSLHPRLPARQVDAAVREMSAGEVVDLLPALRTGRRLGQVFPRTDSSWTDLGAFFAYRELMREAGKRVIDLGEPRLHDPDAFEPMAGFRGNLADKPKVAFADGAMAPAGDDGPWEEEVDLAGVSTLRSLRMPAPPHLEVTPGRAPHLYEIPGEADRPRAVLVGDACCLALIQWLAEHFGRFVFLWSAAELSYEAIELEMPDVVIHVVSERLLVHEP